MYNMAVTSIFKILDIWNFVVIVEIELMMV